MDHKARVQFSEGNDDFGRDAQIKVQQVSEHSYEIHLGFLQLNHRYEIDFEFLHPANFGSLRLHEEELQSLHIRLCSISTLCDLEHSSEESNASSHLTVQLKAHKERMLKEKMSLKTDKVTMPIVLIFKARVLGKGKGTPSLKTGIKCIEVDLEDESEQSDWQGFQ